MLPCIRGPCWLDSAIQNACFTNQCCGLSRNIYILKFLVLKYCISEVNGNSRQMASTNATSYESTSTLRVFINCGWKMLTVEDFTITLCQWSYNHVVAPVDRLSHVAQQNPYDGRMYQVCTVRDATQRTEHRMAHHILEYPCGEDQRTNVQ